MTLRNFSHLIDGQLCGLAHPGRGAELESSLDDLRAAGVTVLVSLDEVGVVGETAQAHGIGHRHIPVVDFGAPTLAQADEFVRAVDEELGRGGQVAVHCQAGIGRTGTMLAAYLIAHGSSVEAATDEVHGRRGHGVESNSQLRFLEEYAAHRKLAARDG